MTIGERPKKKNIESIDLTRKVNLLRLRLGKLSLNVDFDTYIYIVSVYFVSEKKGLIALL